MVKIRWIRAIVSLSLLIISIISAVSGIMLLIMPKGRMGLNRHSIVDLHTVSSIIATGLSVLNAIIRYFKMIFSLNKFKFLNQSKLL